MLYKDELLVVPPCFLPAFGGASHLLGSTAKRLSSQSLPRFRGSRVITLSMLIKILYHTKNKTKSPGRKRPGHYLLMRGGLRGHGGHRQMRHLSEPIVHDEAMQPRAHHPVHRRATERENFSPKLVVRHEQELRGNTPGIGPLNEPLNFLHGLVRVEITVIANVLGDSGSLETCHRCHPLKNNPNNHD